MPRPQDVLDDDDDDDQCLIFYSSCYINSDATISSMTSQDDVCFSIKSRRACWNMPKHPHGGLQTSGRPRTPRVL